MTDYRPRRASAGCTLEPCEGCGNPEHRKKHTLCSACKRKMEKFEQLQNEALVRGAEGARPFNMKEQAYALPYLPHLKDCDALQQAFFDLSMLLSLPTDMPPPEEVWRGDEEARQRHTLWPIGDGRRAHDWTCTRLMDPPVAEKMRTIYALVQSGLKEAHASGAAEGKNLLMSLASGSITNDEFNTRAARLEGQPRDDG